ncbi:helix-turn-helix domain-containing protein [Phyllobacterium zundukense]|uniref:Helix-turn-helix domain-containing protein n=1 Tax=Phyllobacterium zundukense TaxID=1867719 RepID=A0ACD4D558_9HYPH|nr:helix-turn-helix domain-containing protein [Phyllobacterium zundukense]UXN60899.1 helix-turn-helix domain-containing protein [Phyllobacterium zundukense]
MANASNFDRKRAPRRKGPGNTIKGTAEKLDVSEKKVREFIRDGIITPVAFGKLVRIPDAQIEKVREIFA